MNLMAYPPTRDRRGYALVLVLTMTAVSLFALAGALSWSSSNALLNQRNNEYFMTVSAAEAATEKVITAIAQDYKVHGESMVHANLDDYREMVPTATESSYWSRYQFKSPQGATNQNYVTRLSSWGYTELQSQYAGLYGMAATYRIIANAHDTGSPNNTAAGVRQDIQVASIPLFQFAIFYSVDLEINPGADMRVNGRVHSNREIYMQPSGSTLTFASHVTAVGKLNATKKAGDPSGRSGGTVIYRAERDAGVSTLALPIGTNNSPESVYEVLKKPPTGESRTSPMGKERFYNKADLVITVRDAGVTATSGSANNFDTAIPWKQASAFLKTNASFYNKREGKTVKGTEIDVGKLKRWSETNSTLRASLGRDVSIVYVADERSQTSSTQSGVRLVNGQELPSLGLTVATPNPLYVQGHYNVPDSAVGTTNTLNTKPAALVADAITILSENWSDSNSSKALSNRTAGNTTVNAAFLSGIRETDGSYSGGVENFPRFLENWSGKTLTYNGSMVVMFPSQIARATWGGSDVYNPPNRNWAFDLNFMDARKLPPGTPQLLTIIRGEWALCQPGSTS